MKEMRGRPSFQVPSRRLPGTTEKTLENRSIEGRLLRSLSGPVNCKANALRYGCSILVPIYITINNNYENMRINTLLTPCLCIISMTII